MPLQDHFNDYIKAGLYLKGWSPKMAVVYRRAFSSFQEPSWGGVLPHEGSARSLGRLDAPEGHVACRLQHLELIVSFHSSKAVPIAVGRLAITADPVRPAAYRQTRRVEERLHLHTPQALV